MANPYPAQFTDDNSRIRIDGKLNFTDDSNQPSSLPAEWAVGSDGSLTITISDASGLLTLALPGVAGANVQAAVTNDGAGVEEASLAVSGKGGGAAQISVQNGSAAGTASNLDGRGQVAVFSETGLQGFQAWDDAGNVLRFALLVSGQPMIGVTAAPADGDLAASQCALWFDATNGAAKLMVKAKQADGTVKTAAVALS